MSRPMADAALRAWRASARRRSGMFPMSRAPEPIPKPMLRGLRALLAGQEPQPLYATYEKIAQRALARSVHPTVLDDAAGVLADTERDDDDDDGEDDRFAADAAKHVDPDRAAAGAAASGGRYNPACHDSAGLSSIGRSACHSHGLDFHSRILLCTFTTGRQV